MIAALFLLSIVWLGFVLDEEFGITRGDLPIRLAAAIMLGAFWGTWIVFLLSLAFGFGPGSIAMGTALILAGNVAAWRLRGRDASWLISLFSFDRRFWQAAAAPTLLLTAYFAFCVWTDAAGNIFFRGNTRDLAFHMSTVSAFVEQSTFPPFNPQSAAAKLSYHFMANFHSAILCKGGFTLYESLKLPMVLFAFSLGTLTCWFFYSVIKDRIATLFAAILFFLGHIGVVNLAFGLAGYPSGSVPLSLGSWASVEDHLLYPYYNFLNVLIDYFQPQLPFLFGFPVAMLVLLAVYRRYVEQAKTEPTTYFLLATVAFLPLFHMHTFITISPLVGLMVLLAPPSHRPTRPARRGPISRAIHWLVSEDQPTAPAAEAAAPSSVDLNPLPGAPSAFKLVALLLAAVPVGLQLAFILSQKKSPGFSGFDVAQQLNNLSEIPDFLHLQRLWFWVRAAGLTLVLGLMGLIAVLPRGFSSRNPHRREEIALAVLFVATFLHFLVINFYRFTPNWGDSNKFFLYWYLVLCVYAARLLYRWWRRSLGWRVVACIVLALGSVAPISAEWIARLGRHPERLFSASDRLVGEWIRLNTPRDAVFLSANSTVHLVPAFAGRRVVNGSYTRETGFADGNIEDLVARAFREADPSIIPGIQVTHIIVGPAEEARYHINRTKLENRHAVIYDQKSDGVRYSIYEVRERTQEQIERDQAMERARPFVWLSELEPDSVQQFGPLRFDRAFDLSPMRLRGRTFAAGLGTHAPSEIIYSLDGHYSAFEAEAGLDDSQAGGIGSVVFEVWLDDRLAHRSPTLRAGDPPDSIHVELSGASTLRLVVTDAGDGNHSDHADWAGARLIRNAAK